MKKSLKLISTAVVGTVIVASMPLFAVSADSLKLAEQPEVVSLQGFDLGALGQLGDLARGFGADGFGDFGAALEKLGDLLGGLNKQFDEAGKEISGADETAPETPVVPTEETEQDKTSEEAGKEISGADETAPETPVVPTEETEQSGEQTVEDKFREDGKKITEDAKDMVDTAKSDPENTGKLADKATTVIGDYVGTMEDIFAWIDGVFDGLL